jgi:hypothetical protein
MRRWQRLMPPFLRVLAVRAFAPCWISAQPTMLL